MAINPAISTNLSSAQLSFTQSVDVSSTQLNQLPVQGENAAQTQDAARTTRTAQTQSTTATQQTGNAQESGSAEQANQTTAQQPSSDVASRTLRLALTDNSKQLQAQFGKSNETSQTGQQQSTMGTEARRTVMLRNLESMVNMQLAQYTGNEPYSRANYRQILGALGNMQGGGQTSKTEESKTSAQAEPSESTGETEQANGAYKLYSGQAAKTLSVLTPSQGKQQSSQDALDFVA